MYAHDSRSWGFKMNTNYYETRKSWWASRESSQCMLLLTLLPIGTLEQNRESRTFCFIQRLVNPKNKLSKQLILDEFWRQLVPFKADVGRQRWKMHWDRRKGVIKDLKREENYQAKWPFPVQQCVLISQVRNWAVSQNGFLNVVLCGTWVDGQDVEGVKFGLKHTRWTAMFPIIKHSPALTSPKHCSTVLVHKNRKVKWARNGLQTKMKAS